MNDGAERPSGVVRKPGQLRAGLLSSGSSGNGLWVTSRESSALAEIDGNGGVRLPTEDANEFATLRGG